jgi:hypothetical protein
MGSVNVVGVSQAPAAGLARLWSAVSAAHRVLEKRHRYFLTTGAEERLGEQLSLVPVLQGWMPLTRTEGKDLTSLVNGYVEGELETDRDEAALRIVVYVRTMAGDRARSSRQPEGGAG